MSDKQSSESRDERPSSFDAGALASLLEHAGVGYDREEDRPFSLRSAPHDMPTDPDDPLITARDPDLHDFADPDTEVEFLDDGRATDRPPPSDEPAPSSQASEDGPEITDPGALPPA